MVGGTVSGVVARGDEALLNVCDGRNECAVRCGLRLEGGQRIRIALGDHVWWQCGKVYWTPMGSLCRYDGTDEELTGRTTDIPLRKIGYSH